MPRYITEWKGMLVVARGGLSLSGVLAQKLKIKNIRVICLESYSEEKERSCIREIHKPDDIQEEGNGWLVVDDLVDSGTTLQYIRKLYPAAFYVTLAAKPAGKSFVDFYVKDFSQETWVTFPWE